MPMPSLPNYLRKAGVIADTLATNDRLLEIIVTMFHRGEFNKLRLANKAISQFRGQERVRSKPLWGYHGSCASSASEDL